MKIKVEKENDQKSNEEDFRVLEGLQEFIESLELDILKDCSEEKLQEILQYIFVQILIDLVIEIVWFMKIKV